MATSMKIFHSAGLVLVVSIMLIISNGGECLESNHSHFLKANYYGGSRGEPTGHGHIGCKYNPRKCAKYNPYGRPSVCCFNSYCADLYYDRFNCGRCGHVCRYGLTCCGGSCVDLNTDDHHCGTCHTHCYKGIHCKFGLCGYSSGSGSKLPHNRTEEHH